MGNKSSVQRKHRNHWTQGVQAKSSDVHAVIAKMLIATASDGTDIPFIMAPPGHGASFYILPSLINSPESKFAAGTLVKPRKRGYTKPKAWPAM